MAVASVVFERHRAAIVAGINSARRLRRAAVPRQSPIRATRWPALKLCNGTAAVGRSGGPSLVADHLAQPAIARLELCHSFLCRPAAAFQRDNGLSLEFVREGPSRPCHQTPFGSTRNSAQVFTEPGHDQPLHRWAKPAFMGAGLARSWPVLLRPCLPGTPSDGVRRGRKAPGRCRRHGQEAAAFPLPASPGGRRCVELRSFGCAV